MTRPKDQGTRFESFLVAAADTHGYEAWRLAEGGRNDPGDLIIQTPGDDHYLIEAKHRERLTVHTALSKTLEKADTADLPYAVTGTALAWKRTVKQAGNQRRSQLGTGIVVCVSLAEYLDLIGR